MQIIFIFEKFLSNIMPIVLLFDYLCTEHSKNTIMNKQQIFNFISKEEGFRSKVYLDPAGNRTIGFGHLCTDRSKSQVTLDEAKRLLSVDIDVCIAQIEGWLYKHFRKKNIIELLSDSQITALCSFVFNLGIHKYVSYSLSGLILSYVGCKYYNYECDELRQLISSRFLEYDKFTNKSGDKVPLPGLTIRRKAESKLWMN